MKVIILGVSGMIGSEMFKVFRNDSHLRVWGVSRNSSNLSYFKKSDAHNLIHSINFLDSNAILKVFSAIKPDVVINCVGLTKHKLHSDNLVDALEINSVFPHRLASICNAINSRLIHISTDCVFKGDRGGYREVDEVDAIDFYGKSKGLGEISNLSHVVTLRVSTIGHEICSQHGLLEWFLSQKERCVGFRRAKFSGMPTVVFAHAVKDFVLPQNKLSGVYHISAESINKYDLLQLIAKTYKKEIDILPDNDVAIDRSLDGSKFFSATGYRAPEWEDMINLMYTNKMKG